MRPIAPSHLRQDATCFQERTLVAQAFPGSRQLDVLEGRSGGTQTGGAKRRASTKMALVIRACKT